MDRNQEIPVHDLSQAAERHMTRDGALIFRRYLVVKVIGALALSPSLVQTIITDLSDRIHIWLVRFENSLVSLKAVLGSLGHSKGGSHHPPFLAVDLHFFPSFFYSFFIRSLFLTIMVVVSPGYNFARAHGIDSVAGAVVFAVLYVPLLSLFIKRAISRPTFVYNVIALFSGLRIIAFVLRAHLAGSSGHNLKMLVAFNIIFNVGLFALVCSTYTLVLDRGRLSDLPLPNGPISRIARSTLLFRIALFLAILVDITGVVHSVTSSTEGMIHLGHILRKVSMCIFLALCVLVAIQIVLLARTASTHGTYKASNGGFGATHGIHILCVIALLLLTREAFIIATSDDLAKRDDENLWYPFVALTEFVAALMFVSPGLVPSNDELPS